MAGLDLRPFAEEHLEDAGRLLAERHGQQREVEPLLSATFEDPTVARGELERAWGAERASGAVAIRDGVVVGYLIGASREPSWGPNVWVETAGHAVREAETLRDLYGAAAGVWVDAGATRQYAMVPATDPALVDAWFRLGFGQQQALGIREVPPAEPGDGRVAVREATLEDVEELVPLDLLGEHQAGAPVFSSGPQSDPAEVREELAEEIADPHAATLVAELDGRVVGCATVAPVAYSSLHGGLARPDAAAILGYAATLPEVRGSGAGLALTEAVHAWARARGLRVLVVDWRVTNLLASRFWPARGFRTTFLRLYRSIP